MAKHEVATVDEIPPGGRKIVELEGRSVGIFNAAGELYAIRNTCPHQGGPLCRGVLTGFVVSNEPGKYQYLRRGEVIRCPWHGWEFDIKTGQSWCHPESVKARTYQVEVVPGETLAKGPFVAETVPVSVEQHYVVVEL